MCCVAPFELECPPGTVATGFRGAHDVDFVLRSLSLTCDAPDVIAAGADLALDDHVFARDTLSFGTPFRRTCPVGTLLRGFHARSGDGWPYDMYWITGLQPICD